MKKQIELTCSTCGEKFTTEADYIIPGINGYVDKLSGERVVIIDPTAEHHCEECTLKAIEGAKEGEGQ